MAKKKAAPQHVEPDYESESQDVPEEEPARVIEPEPDDEPQAGGKVTQTSAVRAAIDAGADSVEDGVAFVRRHFGMEIERQRFSSIKFQYKKSQGNAAPKAKSGRKPKQAPSQAVEGYLAPPPAPAPANGDGDLLAALEAMKPLVAALGVEKIKRLADLLG